MTHGIFCLRDENNFLIRSHDVPPWHGPTGDTKWTIANDPADAYAWRPGLISLIDTAAAALENADRAGQDTAALTAALQSARGVIKQPVEAEPYAAALRALRREIRALDVPEAKLSVLNLFVTEKW